MLGSRESVSHYHYYEDGGQVWRTTDRLGIVFFDYDVQRYLLFYLCYLHKAFISGTALLIVISLHYHLLIIIEATECLDWTLNWEWRTWVQN